MLNDILLIVNLIILESLLSIDNAAVLAIVVRDLPEEKRAKALRYGLLGAYVFRGASLFFIGLLMKFYFLKILGGLYLVYLCYGHFSAKADSPEEISKAEDSRVFKWGRAIGLSPFVSVILCVEFLDMAFSIDNVFAAAAFSNIFWVVMTGVAIGMLAMRFVASRFEILMRRFSSLEHSAFIVIGLLGIKLIFAGTCRYIDLLAGVAGIMSQHWFDFTFSGFMMLIFFFPLFLKNVNQ